MISAALIELYGLTPPKLSTPAVLDTVTIAAASDVSRCGMAASIVRTVPSMSTSSAARQESSSGAPAIALTLATTISMPPSCCAIAAVHCRTASPSATSQVVPMTLRPSPANAASTPSSLTPPRAQMPTPQPSSASLRAIAWPIPRVPPVYDGLLAVELEVHVLDPACVRFGVSDARTRLSSRRRAVLR